MSSPLIIGHRGASATAPENTLAAFARALADGAEGIEFDVRLARDNVPVVIHDSTLRRTALVDGVVAELTSSELGRMKVGGWFNRQHPAEARGEYQRETIPTLRQVFDLLRKTGALLYLEMKGDCKQTTALAAKVVKVIQSYSLVERVIVESFDLAAIQEVKRLDGSVRTAALFEPRLSQPEAIVRRMKMVDLAHGARADEIALHHALVSGRVVSKAIESGLKVVVWTVDQREWIERANSLGIQALITNRPYQMVRFRNSRVTSE